MLLSVVVPCMNEEDSLPALVERLIAATDAWSGDTEILLVDDGSTDDTWDGICLQSQKHPRVRGLKLSTNRGHQVALTAGLMAATGERIFMLDADLQDPPELLSDMMAMMDRGYDVVYGRRSERKGESWFKKLTAHGFYRILNRLSDVPIPNDTGDFRLVSRRVLDAVLDMPERARFIRGMFAWAGFRQIGIEYVRDPRVAGETKYPMSKMIRLAFDALSSFSIKPLQIATRLAFLTLIVAALMLVYVFWSLILYSTVAGWASTVLVISFFSGIQLLTLGIIGEYLGRLYIEAKGRPLFFIDEQVGGVVENTPETMSKQA
ncbi:MULTISPECIES: glycosyltransferase family 2 protein [unclassified Ruegeria]|uniref:glycosyltransferase family 2 protein n=1 Tax=unclassified Ruegeria TaxID=2625375 RepID=UPI001ADA4DA4|nr:MULTISPECIES: glycosyltransferase family 2 protein [unclassified Ruegeria]MBO9412709.1 glycosyltransferase family 2 protein [Ruegeria sp. R8_1]MBO9416743.1 glycosyltransferase family 2 protein [Ruegeria sp. R8_2]